jgi:hypothetical protein
MSQDQDACSRFRYTTRNFVPGSEMTIRSPCTSSRSLGSVSFISVVLGTARYPRQRFGGDKDAAVRVKRSFSFIRLTRYLFY